jgi:hypothetical protein
MIGWHWCSRDAESTKKIAGKNRENPQSEIPKENNKIK